MVLFTVWIGCTRDEPLDPIAEALPWADCGEGFQCATLRSGDADLAVTWHPSTVPSDGVLVMANGGPGASSIGLLRNVMYYWAEGDPELWSDRNWVAMDNRGVGQSAQVGCVDDDWFDTLRLLEPVPATEAEADVLRDGRDEFQAGCLDEQGEQGLADLGTPIYADDLDTLRDTLGQETLDLIGYSYGTWIGAVYATLYPDRVGRFVLDGVVAPQTTRDIALRGQTEGFELALERFFDRCAADPECPIHDDPAGVYDRLLAASAVTPLAAASDPWGRTLGRNDMRWSASTLLYDPDDEGLAQALAEADAGDAGLLLAGADDGWGRDPQTTAYGSTLRGYWAIGCLDLPWPEGWTDDDVWAFGASLDEGWPRLGSALLTGELTCAGWPVTAPETRIAAPEAPPLLLVGGLYDPATPWDGADVMIDALDNDSRLLTFEGDGHVAMFGDPSGCVYTQERAFLLYGDDPGVQVCP